MRIVLAIVYCFMNLVGCTDLDRSIAVVSKENGTATLDSLTEVRMGTAEFHCNASQTGHCYYTLFKDGATLQTLSLVVAERRQVEGLPAGFDQCVSGTGAKMSAGCKPI